MKKRYRKILRVAKENVCEALNAMVWLQKSLDGREVTT